MPLAGDILSCYTIRTHVPSLRKEKTLSAFHDYTLPRTGKPPLSFAGRKVAQDNDAPTATGIKSKRQPWKDWSHQRWYSLTVYYAANGKWILQICFRSVVKHERGLDEVIVCESLAELHRALAECDPTAPVRQLPPGVTNRDEWQQKIREDVQDRWDAQVSRLLTALEYAERVG
mgnify:CR=1 FL=1